MDISLQPDWKVDIFYPKHQEAIHEPIKAIRNAINNPIGSPVLRDIIHQKKPINKVCIVVSDATRPVPSHLILQALIKELNENGISDNQILILIATGLHRSCREPELQRIISQEIRKRIEVFGHIATNRDDLINLGVDSDEVPIWINKHYYTANLKILTGYVEPHFFAGFSGGRKSVIPGIAGYETIKGNHSAKNIASPFARFGIFEDNPIHKNSIEITKKVGVDFIVNVCINQNHEINKVTAGNLEETHKHLVNFQLKKVFKKIDKPYDIVICGNGGYPLDLNLYQAVKSMAIGEMAVKNGGTIISVNECSDGIGSGHEKFKDLINLSLSPAEIHKKILKNEINVPDQWEIQILARILMKAEIYVISKLKKRELGNIGLKHSKTVEEAILRGLKKHGGESRILILPNGPQILPLMNNKS